MPGRTFPQAPFPGDVPTHPLLVIDFALIKAHDEKEIHRLWEAATTIGFWYLKNHGAEEETNWMYDMAEETMALPYEDKIKYDHGKAGMSFGYKATGAWAIDENGVADNVEFINIAKDDAFSWPQVTHRTYPSTVDARMENTVVPFMRKSLEVNNTLLEVFNDRLGLPKGRLLSYHTMEEHSGTEARCIRNPPRPFDLHKASLGAHTDFGSITFLLNRQGGLQVLVPGSNQWQYVKPIPGLAVCNIADALSLWSGGILRSNMHRVVPPPGEQARFERWSLAFLSRPGDSVQLRALIEDSTMISQAVEQSGNQDFETGVTAGQWFARRIKNQRLDNRKGPETWLESKGTEHSPAAY